MASTLLLLRRIVLVLCPGPAHVSRCRGGIVSAGW